jgi:hypothetical protein
VVYRYAIVRAEPAPPTAKLILSNQKDILPG